MDELALEGTFGFSTLLQTRWVVQSLYLSPPKVPSRAKPSIRLDGSFFIGIRWVVLDSQSWPLSGLYTWPQIQQIVKSLDPTPPKVPFMAKSSIRLNGSFSTDIRWVVMGQQFWVWRRLYTQNGQESIKWQLYQKRVLVWFSVYLDIVSPPFSKNNYQLLIYRC